jgi:DNA-directed RNA polymerase subunit E'/Rpb7
VIKENISYYIITMEASNMQVSTKSQKFKKRVSKFDDSIYSRSLITRSILIPITGIGKNIQATIEKNIAIQFEGKCIVEGFVKPGSSRIITFSSGIVQATNIVFEVVFECQICCPVEGMVINCVARNITKAGIRAESAIETPSPVVVFVARDHHYEVPYFSSIKENDKFNIRVLGQRFELNDKYVSIIAELIKPKETYEPKEQSKKEPQKARLVLI